MEQLESRAIRITHSSIGAEAIAAGFRRARVVGRIHNGSFLLDLRAIETANALAVDYMFHR